MDTVRQSAPATWGATPALTAAADLAVEIYNSERKILRYALTDDDTPPAFAESFGVPIEGTGRKEGKAKGFGMKTGERLWLVMPGGPGTVTMIYGAA